MYWKWQTYSCLQVLIHEDVHLILKKGSDSIITIFLSSPGDLEEERKIIAKEVNKLSTVLRGSYNVEIKLLTWLNDTYSSIGSSGQDVINKLIGDEYDIYLGMVADKLGTPTDEADSGTVEEYKRALTRNKESGKPAMLFFQIERIIKQTTADIKELSRVRDFIDSVRRDGMLTFDVSLNDLDSIVFLHLYKQIDSSGLLTNPKIKELSTAKKELKALTDKLGDAQLYVQKNILKQIPVIAKVDGPNSWKEKWMSISNSFIILKPKTDREIEQASNELIDIAHELQEMLSEFKSSYRNYVESSVRLFSHPMMNNGVVGIEVYLSWIDHNAQLLIKTCHLLGGYAQSYENLHNITPKFSDAKTSFAKSLRHVASEYWYAVELLSTIRNIVKRISDIS